MPVLGTWSSSLLSTTTLERTVKLDPNHFYAKIALARLALLSNQEESFEKQLIELKEIAPDNPDVIRLEVSLAQLREDNATAKRLLETLFAREATMDNVIALAMHRQSVGDVQGGIEQLQGWLQNHPNDTVVREKLAEIYRSNAQFGGVIYQYQRILESDPDNVIALNNLAWYTRNENPAQALDYVQKAKRLAAGVKRDNGYLGDGATRKRQSDGGQTLYRSCTSGRARQPGVPVARGTNTSGRG
jgi:Tfp pilus assembly protein PilF